MVVAVLVTTVFDVVRVAVLFTVGAVLRPLRKSYSGVPLGLFDVDGYVKTVRLEL